MQMAGQCGQISPVLKKLIFYVKSADFEMVTISGEVSEGIGELGKGQ